MALYAALLLFSCTNILHVIHCHPTREEAVRLPNVNNSNPFEINNNLNGSTEPENKKVFTKTVSNFERTIGYLDKTVREVESLINANSTLPRLTRGEILEIIENITKADLLEAQRMLDNNKTKVRDPKAVMLVMPFTPDNGDDGKMQELFTKPPITQLIGDGGIISESKPTTTTTNKRRRRPPQPPPTTKKPEGAFYGEVFPEPIFPERPPNTRKITTKKPISTNFGEKVYTKPQQKPIVKDLEPEITTYRPVQEAFTEKLKYKGRSTTTATTTTTTSTTSTTTTTKKPLTTSTEISVIINNSSSRTETSVPKRRRRPYKPPQRHPNHKYPDEMESTTIKINQGIKIIESPKLRTETTPRHTRFTLPTVPPARPSKPHRFTTAKPFLADVNLPDDLKSTFEDLDLRDSLSKHPIHYEADESYASPPPLKDNVKDILASIGVLPSTTTTTMIPGISNVADTLSPDMKELLMSFGLLPDPNSNKNKQQPINDEPLGVPTAEIKPESYVQFKPLPDSGPARSEMEELLERFGLGKGSRRQKAVTVEKPKKQLSEAPSIPADIIPESMKGLINDLGLAMRNGKKLHTDKTVDKNNLELEATKEDLEKLNQLLDIIKQLEKLNGTATEDDLNKIDLKNLKNLVGSLNKDETVPLDEQDWAPDPLNYDDGLSKNEVKRQENVTVGISVTESVVTVTPSTTTSTTTEESSQPNIKDLEDSFGGASDSEVKATLPPATEAPKTGFYYLLDWNTFLDIDDQKGKRVNLRFQPHSGDPKRFYSVSVP